WSREQADDALAAAAAELGGEVLDAEAPGVLVIGKLSATPERYPRRPGTTAINVAACLAEAGTPVLVIDLDPQANASSGLGVRAGTTPWSTYDLLHGV